ncbi:tetratricopeptide repeat protein [Defluviimonas sp. WL0002]|uniref:Tetratricopeptide repeat protein n=1 Tax=Albidovulum marisflavi TaxID=2984159 RepID=A0ABT2Z852_9RHOB|nr:tetratricopeptide repeat protein [Defluviimonas sp. WL0002]MCV2867315.1 tetratricopeptide repeat protein [Defluviimonas sp. WL0002]
MSIRSSIATIALCSLMLSGCDTAHGQSRAAMAALRDRFDLDDVHRMARTMYADQLRAGGSHADAYAQYAKLADLFPGNARALAALAEMSVVAGRWADAERYTQAALGIDPAHVPARIVRLVLDYTRAVNAGDGAELSKVAERIPELRAAKPDDMLLRRMAISEGLRRHDLAGVIEELNIAILQSPEDRSLHALRLSVHMQADDIDAVQAEIASLTEHFPDDPGMTQSVVAWYEERGAFDLAEDYLRQRANARRDDQAALGALLRFLVERRGLDAALRELDNRIETEGSTSFLQAALASIQFDYGHHDDGLRALRAAVAAAGPDEDVITLKLALAHMLKATGHDAEMLAEVQDILAREPQETEALKLKAGWLIADDQTGEAIGILHGAIGIAPQDPEVMTLLSEAHSRDGDRDRARQMLSLAARASGLAPAETLRYARYLSTEGDGLAAESVLIAALRRAHGDIALLDELGRVYIEMKDWPRARDVARALDRSDEDRARALSVPIWTAVHAAEGPEGAVLTYLDTLSRAAADSSSVQLAIVKAYLDAGQPGGALRIADRLLQAEPGNTQLLFVSAMARERAGQLAAAASGYRAIIESGQANPEVWTGLARVLTLLPGRLDEAAAVLDRALGAFPGNPALLWIRAGVHESRQEYDSAIRIYELLYALDGYSMTAANNLASLLSNRRAEDPDSLARARVVARRLRGSPEPRDRSTYGWVAYLSGNYETAREVFEDAAASLGSDPLVRYHLALTYEALGQIREAREQYEMLAGIVAPNDTREFVLKARAFLDADKQPGLIE